MTSHRLAIEVSTLGCGTSTGNHRASCIFAIINCICILNGILATKFIRLRISLQEYNRTVEKNHNEQVNVDGDFELGHRIIIVRLMVRGQQYQRIYGVVYHC